MRPQQTDVAIIGAGPAGCAAAIELARHCSVVLVDANDHPRPRIGETLPAATQPILEELGMLGQFTTSTHKSLLGQASLWGNDKVVVRDAFLDPRGPGWQLDRQTFDNMGRVRAAECGAHLLIPSQLAQVARATARDYPWTLALRLNGHTFHIAARFLVIASGRSPTPFRHINAAPPAALDRLVCRYATAPARTFRFSLDAFTLVESVAHGWWYRTRLPDDSLFIAHYCDSDLPEARTACDPHGFRTLLANTSAIGPSVHTSGITRIERLSARGQAAQQLCGDDWCAVGDAALAFDPLSSQGIFNALYSGLLAAKAITSHFDGHFNPFANYLRTMQAIKDEYCYNLTRYYAIEQRFSQNPFWQRRRLPL